MDYDELYMRRALQLAELGEGQTSPNPMVGAVIVAPDGRIIGEGFHRRYGEGHAEVNAIASVRESDRQFLQQSTMYVTLEPCSHYGKTPPCAKLIIDTKIPHVVVGAKDPFPEVSGRGIKLLRDAGIKVTEDILAEESRMLNKKFITAHECKRPFVTLKWAQSADGYMAYDRGSGSEPYKFSDRINSLLVHRLRSLHDAIIVGSQTVICDNPRLTCRLWPGRSPLRVVVDRRQRICPEKSLLNNPCIISDCASIGSLLKSLYNKGLTSVLVEGGPTILQSFIDENLWDEARVEIAPVKLNDNGSALAPNLPVAPYASEMIGKNLILNYRNQTVNK